MLAQVRLEVKFFLLVCLSHYVQHLTRIDPALKVKRQSQERFTSAQSG